jgi:hypothetical protein
VKQIEETALKLIGHEVLRVSLAGVYSSTLKMEATYSSETVDFQRTTRRYIPEGHANIFYPRCLCRGLGVAAGVHVVTF